MLYLNINEITTKYKQTAQNNLAFEIETDENCWKWVWPLPSLSNQLSSVHLLSEMNIYWGFEHIFEYWWHRWDPSDVAPNYLTYICWNRVETLQKPFNNICAYLFHSRSLEEFKFSEILADIESELYICSILNLKKKLLCKRHFHL